MSSLDFVFDDKFLNQTVTQFTGEFGKGKTIQETEKILYSKISIWGKLKITDKVKKDLLEEGWYPIAGVSLPTIKNLFRSGDMSSRDWSNNNNKLDSKEAIHSIYELLVEDYDLEKKLPFDIFQKMKIKELLNFIEKNHNLWNQQ